LTERRRQLILLCLAGYGGFAFSATTRSPVIQVLTFMQKYRQSLPVPNIQVRGGGEFGGEAQIWKSKKQGLCPLPEALSVTGNDFISAAYPLFYYCDSHAGSREVFLAQVNILSVSQFHKLTGGELSLVISRPMLIR
jgi:hypothetical protein